MNLPARIKSYQSLVDVINACKLSHNPIIWHEKEATADSYQAIQADAYALAQRLYQKIHHQRVGLVAEMNREFIIRFFACQYLGITPVLLPVKSFNETHWHHKIELLLQSAQCNTLFGDYEANDFATITCFTEHDFVASCSEDWAITAHSDAYIQFSSGTTGIQKGIVVTQRALLTNIYDILIHGLDIQEEDKAISWLPFFHDMGLVGFFLAPFVAQCELHYLVTRQFLRNPLRWLELISTHQLTISYAPNFAYERLSRYPADKIPQDLNLQSWRIAGIGAEKIQMKTLNAFYDNFQAHGFQKDAFWPSYGMAEATLAVSMRLKDDPLIIDHGNVSCGRILPAFNVTILPTKTSPPSAESIASFSNNMGELAIKASCLAHRYSNETSLPLTQNYFLTGDLGYIKENQLFIIGRKKECIIINGRNIWPQAIEAELEKVLPASIAFLVTPIQYQDQEQIAMVFAKLQWDEEEMNDITMLCLETLFSHFGCTARGFFITNKALLKTTSGKPARLVIAEAIQAGSLPVETRNSI